MKRNEWMTLIATTILMFAVCLSASAKDVKNVPGKVGDYVKFFKGVKAYPVLELRLTRRIWVK